MVLRTLFHLLYLSGVIPIILSAYSGLELNSFIKHFEPLYYDNHKLRSQHARIKRQLTNSNSSRHKINWSGRQQFTHSSPFNQNNRIRIDFSSHNRLFRLVISTDNSLFSEDIEFESTNRGSIDYDTNNVITGYLEDEENSLVEGVITSEGLIDGYIQTPTEEYYIEPADRYFKSKDFHSIMYLLSSVMFPTIESRSHLFIDKNLSSTSEESHSQCVQNHSKNSSESSSEKQSEIHYKNNHGDIKKKNSGHPFNSYLNRFIVKSVNDNKTDPKFNGIQSRRRKKRQNSGNNSDKDDHGGGTAGGGGARGDGGLFWKDFDSLHYTESEPYGVRAVKRTQWAEDMKNRHVVIDPKKTTCMLYLQADHLFYQKMGSDEACIEAMTRHVQKVNSIYRNTDFDQDGRSDNISFLIKRIKVHTGDALKDPEYRYSSHYGVEKFLELFSEEDYDAFCLAYMFTYRDFEGGTLGLAWTGDLKNAGGVCEKNGHYRGSLKSLNTGIVTLLNYGKHVPPIVSHVTLAHEIGHNFGSPHDPEEDTNCTPGGEDGNYIMFARATSGDKRNNNKFSPCSLKSINSVLNTKAKSIKGCFQEPQESICGNEVVEAGEECDCGWEEDCKEPCCYPMRTNPPKDEVPCRLRPNVICSPSQGPCCTQDCKLKIGNKCRDDNGCRTASYCNTGQGPDCPSSTNKPNKTICNEEYVCYMGECTGSICMAYGLESCQCKRGPTDPMTKSCELCCRLPSMDSTCKSSFEWNSVPYDVPDLFAKAGTPCDNYNGYCDAFQSCREVDPSGPLATLRRLLLSNESMASLKRWFNEQSFYLALLSIILLLIVIILVKVFGKRSLHFRKTELEVDVLSLAKNKRQINQMSSSLSSFNGLSRSALHSQNPGSIVNTSLQFHEQHNHHSLEVEHHHYHTQQHHQYYGTGSQPQLYSPSNPQIFNEHYLYEQNRNHSSSHRPFDSIEYSDCPPINITGNGWV